MQVYDHPTFRMACQQFDLVADHLQIPDAERDRLKYPKRSMTVALPIHRDDGRTQVFTDRRNKHDSYRLLIAEDELEGVVGFIDYAYKESDNFDHDGRIFSFYFLPEFQRQGLGGLLFRKCLRRMRGECYRSVCLDTFEANPLRTFYEKMGGRFVAADEHEVGDRFFPTVVYGWDDLSNV